MPRETACALCDAPMEPGAVLCIECGYHQVKRKRLRTKSKRIRHEFGRDPRTPLRLGLGVGLGAAGLALLVAGAALALMDDQPTWPALLVVGALLLFGAAGVGCGRQMTVTRARSGEPILRMKTWVCFLPVPHGTVDLSRWEALYFDYGEGDDSQWWSMHLGRDGGDEKLLVYRGGDEEMMKDLADAIKDVAGLRWERL